MGADYHGMEEQYQRELAAKRRGRMNEADRKNMKVYQTRIANCTGSLQVITDIFNEILTAARPEDLRPSETEALYMWHILKLLEPVNYFGDQLWKASLEAHEMRKRPMLQEEL